MNETGDNKDEQSKKNRSRVSWFDFITQYLFFNNSKKQNDKNIPAKEGDNANFSDLNVADFLAFFKTTNKYKEVISQKEGFDENKFNKNFTKKGNKVKENGFSRKIYREYTDSYLKYLLGYLNNKENTAEQKEKFIKTISRDGFKVLEEYKGSQKKDVERFKRQIEDKFKIYKLGKLRGQVKELTTELSKSQAALGQSQAEVQGLEDQVKTLNQTVSSKDIEIKTLTEALEKQKKESKQELETEKKKVKELDLAGKNKDSQIKEGEEKLATQGKELKDTKLYLTNETNKAKNLREVNEVLSKTNEQKQEQIDSLNKTNDELTMKLKTTGDEKDIENNKLKEQLLQQTKAADAAAELAKQQQEQIGNLTQENGVQASQITQQKQEEQKLQESQNEAKQKIYDLSQRNDELKSKLETTVNENLKSKEIDKKALEEAKQELEAANTRAEEAKKKADAAEKNSKPNEQSQLEKEITDLKKKIEEDKASFKERLKGGGTGTQSNASITYLDNNKQKTAKVHDYLVKVIDGKDNKDKLYKNRLLGQDGLNTSNNNGSLTKISGAQILFDSIMTEKQTLEEKEKALANIKQIATGTKVETAQASNQQNIRKKHNVVSTKKNNNNNNEDKKTDNNLQDPASNVFRVLPMGDTNLITTNSYLPEYAKGGGTENNKTTFTKPTFNKNNK